MKLIKRIFAIIAVAINVLLLCNNVNAASIGENKALERGPLGYYCVQKWDGSKWIYLTYNTTYYTDINGKKYVAYCLSPGSPGVGYVSGEKETYNVNVKEVLNDDRIWRIIKNGYPYKSIQELGVETVDDAYFATMQAVNSVLRGYTLEQAKQLYSVGQFAINGENYADIQRRGTKTLNAMFSLINTGLNGTETRKNLEGISVKNKTDFVKENENYYSQSFKVTSNSSISGYTIHETEGLPNSAYIADAKGNKKTSFNSGEYFKVMVPKSDLNKNINVKITVKAQQRNYPIYYGESTLQGHQDYALCNEEYSDVYATAKMSVVTNKSKLTILKVDKDTNKPLQGVKFQVTNSSNITNTYTTNEKGKIEIANLYAGTVKIKEISAPSNYKTLAKDVVVDIGYGESKEVKIENEFQKGSIVIEKVDNDDSKIKLSNVKIRLTNKFGETVLEGKTNNEGILKFNNIPIGEYYVEEIETLQNYVLLKDKINVKVESNKTIEIEIKNERKKGNLKVIKVDYDNNEIKLQNVKFQLKNIDGEVIKEGITNENGEIFFENIVEGKYILTEVETQEEYMLQDMNLEIEIEYGKTSEAVVKNKKIQIKEVPVEVEKIVEIEKPVEIEKEVEKIVEVEKPVEIEKEVEKVVEVEKPVIIEKVLEKPIEKIVFKEAKELPKTGSNEKIIYGIIVLILLILYVLALYIRKSRKHNK